MNKILYNTGLNNEKTLEGIIKGRLSRVVRSLKLKELSSVETVIGGEMPKEKDGVGVPVFLS